MEQYLNNISSFPTAVYSVFLGIVVIYWLLSIIGAVDIDTLDMDIDIDIETSAISGLTGFMLTFGLTGVPIAVIISVWSVYAWLSCYFAVEYLLGMLPEGLFHTLAAIGILPASFFITVPLVAQTIKPLCGFFKNNSAIKKANIVGSHCTVRTLSVSEEFGQCEIDDGEAGMILAIRAVTPNNISKGDKVVIIAYNKVRSTFDVVSEQEFQN